MAPREVDRLSLPANDRHQFIGAGPTYIGTGARLLSQTRNQCNQNLSDIELVELLAGRSASFLPASQAAITPEHERSPLARLLEG